MTLNYRHTYTYTGCHQKYYYTVSRVVNMYLHSKARVRTHLALLTLATRLPSADIL